MEKWDAIDQLDLKDASKVVKKLDSFQLDELLLSNDSDLVVYLLNPKFPKAQYIFQYHTRPRGCHVYKKTIYTAPGPQQ